MAKPIFIEYSEGLTPLFNGSEHRIGVWDCPYCGYGNFNDCDFWDFAENIHEIILNGRICKMDGIIVLSECPNCHKISWCHRDLDFYSRFTDKTSFMFNPKMEGIDHDRLEAEVKRRAEECHNAWEGCLCQTCRYVQKLEHHKYFKSVNCGGDGWTRWGGPEKTCDRYKKGKAKYTETTHP